ncbi:MAG: hypothetical protein AB7P04_01720 [Bacteriovoracia bacterium]
MRNIRIFLLCLVGVVLSNASSHALDLDWSGQFKVENHWLYNYTLDRGNTVPDASRVGQGYYIPGGGSSNAAFQSAFLRLRPSVIVNDNIYIKSELWLGDPIFGFFGSGAPYTMDQRQYYSNQSRGSTVSAQRMWGEILSDVGTVQIGRAPLHWGLGLVWNNGDGVYDRYQSTGDMIRLQSKFGSFSFAPAFIKYTMGNNLGGACPNPTAGCTAAGGGVINDGNGSVVDYSLMFKYENMDEDVEMGVNFVKRIGGSAQNTTAGYQGITGTGAGMNYNIWDIYGKKTLGPVSFAAEIPITQGEIGGSAYKAFSLGFESQWKINPIWDVAFKAGRAGGQTNSATATPGEYRGFFFHPGYKVGLIMFNYQFANFAGPNSQNDPAVGGGSLRSPFDNPITNAQYFAFGGGFRVSKWQLRTNWVFASALETAVAGTYYFNTWNRNTVLANATQASNLGWEMDYGTSFFWDDNLRFDFDLGWWFPGDFYRFSNTALENGTTSVFGISFKVGVNF